MKTHRYNTETLSIKPVSFTAKKAIRKTWAKATSIPGWTSLKRQNANIEAQYHHIIALVKTHHLKHGDCYFERDYKNDPTEGYLAMHTFLTSSFYFYLECGLDLVYHVEWGFHNCQFESAVTTILTSHPMDIRNKQVSLTPDLPTFFSRTARYQLPKFIHCFKG